MRARSVLVTIAKGFCMGTADVVPGVSGGTMAFILGIYQRLLLAIRAFDSRLLKLIVAGRFTDAGRHVDLVLLIPLGCGVLGALLFFTRVVPLPALIRSHPEPIYSVFFGLVSASIVVLFRSAPQRTLDQYFFLIAGTGVGFGIVNLVPVATPTAPWFIFLSGSLAISAMLLPGISGAFILLILRKYAYVFDAVGRLDVIVLLPFMLGIVAGLMLFSRVLAWLLERWYQRTLLSICGLLLGSLWVIWPFQERHFVVVRDKARLVHSEPIWPAGFDATVAWACVLMALGFASVLLLQWLARRVSTEV